MTGRNVTASANRKLRKPKPIMKRREWRYALDALKSDVRYTDLAAIEQDTKSSGAHEEPRWVPIKELAVAENVFQWRGGNSNLLQEDGFMRELMRAVELGHNLAPILVKRFGDKLYVVDGHHRLAAYIALNKTTVPVKYFNEDLRAAYLKSLDANVRDKLPITKQDKFEAAFRLVKYKMRRGDRMTWDELRRRAVVSIRLVYKMRKTLEENQKAWEWSWAETRGKTNDAHDQYEQGSDEFRDKYARELADQIMSKVKINLTANPDITAMALEMISEQLPPALIEEWMERVREFLIEEAREAKSEAAERAFDAPFAELDRARIYGS